MDYLVTQTRGTYDMTSEQSVLKIDLLEAGKRGIWQTVFANVSGLNTEHPATFLERVAEHYKDSKVLTRPLKSSVGCAKQTSAIPGSSTSKLYKTKNLLLTSWCQIPQHVFRGLVLSVCLGVAEPWF